jgi:hypothetical protein
MVLRVFFFAGLWGHEMLDLSTEQIGGSRRAHPAGPQWPAHPFIDHLALDSSRFQESGRDAHAFLSGILRTKGDGSPWQLVAGKTPTFDLRPRLPPARRSMMPPPMLESPNARPPAVLLILGFGMALSSCGQKW